MKNTFLVLAALLLSGCDSAPNQTHDDHGHEQAADFARGPHGGRLLEHEDFELELAIFESGIPPEYRVWLFEDGKALPPDDTNVEVELVRLGGKVDRFTFRPEADYLRSSGVVAEPHSFDVTVTAVHDGESMQWKFASYEGRTSIHAQSAREMGVETTAASEAVLKEQLPLTGVIQADPSRISRVRARYPGVIREVAAQPWSTVARGAVLAQVQSNESLQNYTVAAPIGGVIVEHRAQVGESTGEDTLFTIVDLSRVWVELDVFQTDLDRVSEGQSVEVLDVEGRKLADGRISRIAPLAIHGSQSVRARVSIDNAAGALRPGQFVTGRVLIAETRVPLAVEKSALQKFRDFDVVFEQVGDTYEVRMLKLGREDAERVEILSGLDPGARYVTKNSYLIKADIEKSGASHDH